MSADSIAQIKGTLEAHVPSTKQLPLDTNSFTRFLNETYGKMLDLSYQIVTEKSLQSRIARIKKKIQKSSEFISETDSDASSINQD